MPLHHFSAPLCGLRLWHKDLVKPSSQEPKEYEADTHRYNEIGAETEENATDQQGDQSNDQDELDAVALSDKAPTMQT